MTKEMILSLNGDTFQDLKRDFDTVLNRTVGNMTMKGAEDATITLKLDLSLEKSSVGVGNGVQEVTIPSFKHTISSVMQVKEKMTGQLAGEYGMVWDENEERWVLRKIDNGQMNLFDYEEGGQVIDAEYSEVNGLPEGQRGLPESTENGEGDYPTEDAENEPDDAEGFEKPSVLPQDDTNTPFGWLCQFIGEDLNITESMGNYTVRTSANKVVLSSATGVDSPFYCPAEKLAPHVGHQVVCAGYGEDAIVNVSIECEDCSTVLFDLDAPETELLTDEETAEAAADMAEGDAAEEDTAEEDENRYEYETPEE